MDRLDRSPAENLLYITLVIMFVLGGVGLVWAQLVMCLLGLRRDATSPVTMVIEKMVLMAFLCCGMV